MKNLQGALSCGFSDTVALFVPFRFSFLVQRPIPGSTGTQPSEVSCSRRSCCSIIVGSYTEVFVG